jgi:hypothetical protein
MVAPQQLTNADALYYTAPANTTGVIKRATFTNTTAGAVTVTANIVPVSGASAASNQIISAKSIAAGDCYVAPELAGKTLPAGSMLRMLASAAGSITVAVDGVEIV